MRIAIIGAGISGLSAAWFLSRRHEVWLFEQDSRLGGHTHTISVGGTPVDTGFIVHNETNYPLFCRLMRELGVATRNSDMSFGVSAADGSFEYSSRGLNGFFAQRSNLARPRHYGLLAEILRFNRSAPSFLLQANREQTTMGEFLREGNYRRDFIERYLYPMASAVWSMPLHEMDQFPARTLLRFFHNHGMLGVNTHPQWKTIVGGSDRYLEPLTEPFRERIVLNAAISAVNRTEDGLRLHFAGRAPMDFDEAVFACHGNQILPSLATSSSREREILKNFSTTRNQVCLHTDERLLPRRTAARASWNYRIGDNSQVTMTYDMNRLQGLTTPEQYCVTLNSSGQIEPSAVIRHLEYAHPVYNAAAIGAQRRWSEISGVDRIHYCGAYWFNGFHEDGVRSALRVANALGVQW